MKTKSIRVSDGHAPLKPADHQSQAAWDAAVRFRVEQITDSIEYRTGQYLERNEIEQLCERNDWKVTIVPHKTTSKF